MIGNKFNLAIKKGGHKNILLFLFLLITSFYPSYYLKSQSVENVKATVSEDIIIITYDLIAESDEVFNVNLYSSKDNFDIPLSLVTGDVGSSVKAGKQKRIEWLAKNELGDFKGNLIFEIKAFLPEPAFKPLNFKNFSLKSIKKGKSYRLQWTGGKPNENINIYLFEDGVQKEKIATVNNDGKYLWKIPKGKKSSKYQVQLNGESGIVATNEFQIKSGSPLLLISGGVIATAAIVYLVTRDPSNNNNNTDSELPIAPDPN